MAGLAETRAHDLCIQRTAFSRTDRMAGADPFHGDTLDTRIASYDIEEKRNARKIHCAAERHFDTASDGPRIGHPVNAAKP
jgi:hypothetical protein